MTVALDVSFSYLVTYSLRYLSILIYKHRHLMPMPVGVNQEVDDLNHPSLITITEALIPSQQNKENLLINLTFR